jgi:hypothetical protein
MGLLTGLSVLNNLQTAYANYQPVEIVAFFIVTTESCIIQ